VTVADGLHWFLLNAKLQLNTTELEMKQSIKTKIYTIADGLIGAGSPIIKGKNVYKNQNRGNIEDGFNQWPTNFLPSHAKNINPKERIMADNLRNTNSDMIFATNTPIFYVKESKE